MALGIGPEETHVAAVPPTPTDDSASGYGIGAAWMDSATRIRYKCLDNTASAAIWKPIGALKAHDATIHAPVGLWQLQAGLTNTGSSGAGDDLVLAAGTERHTAMGPGLLGFEDANSHAQSGLGAGLKNAGAMTAMCVIHYVSNEFKDHWIMGVGSFSLAGSWGISAPFSSGANLLRYTANTGAVTYTISEGLPDHPCHLAMTRTAANQVAFFVDGQQVGATSVGLGAAVAYATERMSIGGRPTGNTDHVEANTIISSVKLVHSELTAAQVLAESRRCGF